MHRLNSVMFVLLIMVPVLASADQPDFRSFVGGESSLSYLHTCTPGDRISSYAAP